MTTAILIVAALLVAPAMFLLDVIDWLPAVLIEIAVLFVAAWWLDRKRSIGARDPFLDANRPDVPAGLLGDQVVLTTLAGEEPADHRIDEA